MEFKDVETFLDYYTKIKNRTRNLFDYIPPEKIEWTYRKGKFTIGDIIRHLANIERMMYAENVQQKPSLYDGCDKNYASGYDDVIKFYDQQNKEAMEIFAKMQVNDFYEKCTTPAGIKITTWKWLRAMVEHEIHHRGQIYIYLGMLNVETPPLYGLTAEQVIDRKFK